VRANGITVHGGRAGAGAPLLLLHGWPEFWLTWAPCMRRLADRFQLLAPDLRGFGDTEKPPSGPSRDAGPEVHAADMLALLDELASHGSGSSRTTSGRSSHRRSPGGIQSASPLCSFSTVPIRESVGAGRTPAI